MSITIHRYGVLQVKNGPRPLYKSKQHYQLETRDFNKMSQFLFALLFSPSFFVFIQLGIDPSDSSIPHVKVVQKLGAWAKANNRDNQSDPMQFDIASLIRR